MNQVPYVMLNSFQHLMGIPKQVRDDRLKDMKYKAIIFDVDGTLVLNKKEAMPSKRVIEAIAKADEHIAIAVATSRPYFMLTHITSLLNLTGPSIVNGGAQIVDLPSGKVLWELSIERKDLEVVANKLTALKVRQFWMNTGESDALYIEGKIPEKVLQVYVEGLTPSIADEMFNKLSYVSPTIAVHKVPCWNEGKEDIIITHALATKQHGIMEVAKILGISTQEIIGVGDGYNDFPLLMACGLKVAMGNAVPDLKAIADYIAPSVEEDGVADVINKFVLN